MRVTTEDAYASELLHSQRSEHLSAADHGLATELVMGVLRWQSGLDAAIAEFSSVPLPKLDLEVLVSLRIAAYQLAFLDRVPARAAIHESVELVKRARKRSAAAFVNAVLRKMADDDQWQEMFRRATTEIGEPVDGKQSAEPGRSVNAIADLYSHPGWLVERWVAAYGSRAAQAICEYDQTIPPTSVRFRDGSARAELEDAGIVFSPGTLLRSAACVVSGDITRTAAFRQGRIAVQDEASQLVALLVGKGNGILDCCAAPGGKTRILAERNPNAAITAVELHPHRARLLRELVPAENVQVIAADVCSLPGDARFDRVLADVPCSGTGTLAHNPEIKWRLKPEDLLDLQARQLAILHAAMERVAPGGRLIYSTCSLEREENEIVVERALAGNAKFCVIPCGGELERLNAAGELKWKDLESLLNGPYLRTIPGMHPGDGFFAAILERA